MPKCSGCASGAITVLDTPSINLTLTGSVLSADFADYFNPVVFGFDNDLSASLDASNVGYTQLNDFDKFFGGTEVHINPYTPPPGVGADFHLELGPISIAYDLTVTIFVSTPDCSNKLFMRRFFNITTADALDTLTLGPLIDWDEITVFGSDLSAIVDGSNISVLSDGGLCITPQMMIRWTED